MWVLDLNTQARPIYTRNGGNGLWVFYSTNASHTPIHGNAWRYMTQHQFLASWRLQMIARANARTGMENRSSGARSTRMEVRSILFWSCTMALQRNAYVVHLGSCISGEESPA